ncbi:MAG: hypothetical protein DKM22_07615 [Candidatus Melainabacteria bacterium]|nr:MAG: hypothetical protein DKM22_07615 [Candidatus Melainabacteria bacterium]
MKKKILSLMLFFICSILLTGCIKVDTEVTLDKKGHAQIEGKLLVNDLLSGSLDEEYSEFEKYSKEKNLEVSKVSENGHVGVKQIYKTDNYNKNDIKLPEIFEPTNENKRFLTIKHNLFFTKTNIDWIAHFIEVNNKVLTKEDQSLFESTLKINIPVKATFSNADSRNDMTNSYEWKLEPTKENKIQLEYKIINWLNVVLFTLFIVSIISLLVLLVLKQNKKNILVSSILPIVLLVYFVIVSSFCIIKNNINKSQLPVNYYEIAKNNEKYFVDDFAVAKVDDKYGLVNKKNIFIVKPENKYVENLDEDFCLVCKEDLKKCAYFNKKTKKYLTSFKYFCRPEPEFIDDMTSTGFQEGLARVVVSEHGDINVGFIDATGKEVIPLKYKTATPFVDGESIVTRGYRDYNGIFIDKSGKEIKKDENKNVDKVAVENQTKNNTTTTTTNNNTVKPKNTVKKVETKSSSKQTVVKQVPKVVKQQSQKQENSEIDDFMN